MRRRSLHLLTGMMLAALIVLPGHARNLADAFGATGTASPRTISGTLYMQNPSSEFALFYMPDNTRPQPPEIVVERTGFSASLYVIGGDTLLSLKNRDNIAHRISISHGDGPSETLVHLQPRQGKSARIHWPQNTLMTLRSNRSTFANSYIAHLPTANFLQLHFAGHNQVALTFDNRRDTTTAYLLMPDTDPLTFTLTQGETKSLAITRDGVPVGSLVVTGK